MATPNDRGPRGGKRAAPRGGSTTRSDAAAPSTERRGRGASTSKSKGKPAPTAASRSDSKPASKPAAKPAAKPAFKPAFKSPGASRLRAPEAPPAPVASGGAVVRVSRILDAPASAVFRALNDPARRGWSPEPLYRVVSALAPRFVRLALPDGSQLSVGITRQGNVRCSVAVEQTGLPASVPVNEARERWMGALAALAEQLDAEWD